jgi:putative transport protein
MIALLLESPLLLLFLVSALGFALGRIKIAGSSLGVAAVLFVGLAFGSLHPDMKLPDIVYQMGLVLFVYTIGLSSGAGFFASFRKKGLRDNLLIVLILIGAAGMTVLAKSLLGLKPTLTAGMFCGSLTNTPALAAVLEYLKTHTPAGLADQIVAEPVIGYSIAYPIGVMGMILAIQIMQRIWKVDYRKEESTLEGYGWVSQQIFNRVVEVTQEAATLDGVGSLFRTHGWKVVFGRLQRNGHLTVVRRDTRFQIGDLVNVVGPVEEMDRVMEFLGVPSEEHIELDRTEVDYRRIFVSSAKVAGRTLRELDLPERYGAVVTRIRRGDSDLIPNGETVLELGDRVRVLTHRDRLAEVSEFFGDSYKSLSEIDIVTFSLGLTLGLLLGAVPIPLPGVTIKLGLAGGPLIMALILGALRRTGNLVWNMPYSANLTLRQIGLILFLAGVGTRAGYAFVSTFTHGGGIGLFLAGALITGLTAILTLVIGYRVLKIPMGILTGMLAGLQTQPAILGYALEQADNDLPNIGYATVYPVATLTKIVLAQLILTFLSR